MYNRVSELFGKPATILCVLHCCCILWRAHFNRQEKAGHISRDILYGLAEGCLVSTGIYNIFYLANALEVSALSLAVARTQPRVRRLVSWPALLGGFYMVTPFEKPSDA